MPKKPPPRNPQLAIAGALCVAFVNTAHARDNNRQFGVDSYDTLLTWALQTELLSSDQAADMRQQAAEQPGQVESMWSHVLELRATLTRMFSATAQGRKLPADDLARLNRVLAETLPPVQLTYGGQGLIRGWADTNNRIDRLLLPVLQSAMEVLTADHRLASCAAPECSLMFVDPTPKPTRMWCDYKVCGRRANSLRYYHRRGKSGRL